MQQSGQPEQRRRTVFRGCAGEVTSPYPHRSMHQPANDAGAHSKSLSNLPIGIVVSLALPHCSIEGVHTLIALGAIEVGGIAVGFRDR